MLHSLDVDSGHGRPLQRLGDTAKKLVSTSDPREPSGMDGVRLPRGSRLHRRRRRRPARSLVRQRRFPGERHRQDAIALLQKVQV